MQWDDASKPLIVETKAFFCGDGVAYFSVTPLADGLDEDIRLRSGWIIKKVGSLSTGMEHRRPADRKINGHDEVHRYSRFYWFVGRSEITQAYHTSRLPLTL